MAWMNGTSESNYHHHHHHLGIITHHEAGTICSATTSGNTSLQILPQLFPSIVRICSSSCLPSISRAQPASQGLRRKRAQKVQENEDTEDEEEEGGDDAFGDEIRGLQSTPMDPKRRRLTADQVEFLETSFLRDLKLEPERKAEIAKLLGIRPRQVAVWFQNRRARWKHKQLELRFDSLKASFEALVEDNDAAALAHSAIVDENARLLAEVSRLKGLLQKQQEIGLLIEDGLLMARKEEEASAKSGLTSPRSLAKHDQTDDSGQESIEYHRASPNEGEEQEPNLPTNIEEEEREEEEDGLHLIDGHDSVLLFHQIAIAAANEESCLMYFNMPL